MGRKQFKSAGLLTRFEDFIVYFVAVELLLVMWSAFKIVYLKFEANSVISNVAFDIPDIRLQAFSEPRSVGIHYFGDFLQPFDWATLSNPWTYDPDFLAMYPPLPIYLLKLLINLPYFVALFIYLATMVIGSAWIVWWLLPSFSKSIRLLSAVGLGIVSAPALMAFDRGNNIGFFALLFGLFAYAAQKDKRWLMITTFVLMASIKIYPLVLLIVFVKKRMFREIATALTLGALITLGLFALTPGDFTDTLSGFISANTEGSAYWSLTLETGIHLFLQFFGILITPQTAVVVDIVVASWFALKWLGVALLVILPLVKKAFTVLETTLFSGFAMMLLYTAPHNYAWTWSLPMIAILINNLKIGLGQMSSLKEMWGFSRLQTVSLLGLLLTVLPAPIAVPGTTKSILPFVGYTTILVALSLELYFYRKERVEKKNLAKTSEFSNLFKS